MHVLVLPYDSQWAKDFLEIKTQLSEALRKCTYLSIEHVGSTSVPGMPAKPVIDIDIIIDRPQLDDAISELQGVGYVYAGDQGIPDRSAFHWPGGHPPRNLYVCVNGCQALRNHLAVRDACRNDARVRDEYARVKLELSLKEWTSVDAYCEAKNDVLDWVLTQAGISQEERDIIRGLNTVQ